MLKAIQRKWDWWIYRRAHMSLKRICATNPGFSYLLELYVHDWNTEMKITPELKRATEVFYKSLEEKDNVSI